MRVDSVDGVKVVTREPAVGVMPMHPNLGLIPMAGVEHLLMEDGSEAYGCVESGCDYVADSVRSVTAHRRMHGPVRSTQRSKTPAANGHASAEAFKTMTLAELIDRAGAADRVIADRDEWKQRALTAERQINTLRRALKGLDA